MGEKKGAHPASTVNQTLYRKYRSTSFDELVGQEHVTDLLKAAVKNGTFSHAYLFTGQRGTGKTSAARILAYAINGLPYGADAGRLDIIEIDAASNRRIDDIRDLREKVFIAPVSTRYKVYIIDEVHMLTTESFNALLKILEEPPAHVVFILATTELHKVPATIISRTQRFHFRPVAQTKVVDHLKFIAQEESIDITDDALQLIAEHGGGSLRDSISLLDQLGSLTVQITAELVEQVLGRARTADIQQLLVQLETNDQTGIHTLIQHMLANGTSPVTLADQLVAAILKTLKPEARWYELSEKLMSVAKAHFPELLLLSTLLGFTSHTNSSINSPQVTTNAPLSSPKSISRPTVTAVAPTITKEITPPSTKKETPKQSVQTPVQSVSEGSFDWQKVLDAMKKTDPGLHAVLSRAEAVYADNKLTLAFQYTLHRKKLEQAKYRSQLSQTIKDVCAVNPDIVITALNQPVQVNETVKQVANLMGGGEQIAV